MQKYIVTAEEYRHRVRIGKRVNYMAENIRDKDQKKKFLMRNYPPTVEQLEEHEVLNDIPKYFPYFLYYHEPDLCSFLFKNADTDKFQLFIDNVFKERIEIVETERETGPYVVTDEEYDNILDNYDAYCESCYENMTEYEYDVFYKNDYITYERLISVEPKKNLERLFPIILGMAEPSLDGIVIPVMESDEKKIKEYLNDLMFEDVEFA